MAEEVYGTKFSAQVLSAIVRRLGISWVLPPAPELPEDCGAIDVTAALADVVRIVRTISGSAFECPFDFDGAPRAFTAAETADVLIDLAMRAHRVAGDDHASEPYDTLRTRPCLQPYIVRVFLVFCRECGATPERVIASAEAAGFRLGDPVLGSGSSEPGRVPADTEMSFVRMGSLCVGSAAQPQILIEFMQSHQFGPRMVMAAVVYLQERIERAGRALSDEEFRIALEEFVAQGGASRSGMTSSGGVN